MQIFRVVIYENDELFIENELQFSENSASSKNIAFVNQDLLREHNINIFSYFMLNDKKLVCLFGSKLIQKDAIHISQVAASSLILKDMTVTINLNKPVPTREYDTQSAYNFLPKIPICHRIVLSNIWNGNSSLFDIGMVSELLQEVFYAQIGDVLALDLSGISDLQKFKQDKKKLQKLIKFSLTKDNKNLYCSNKRLLLVQVENILVLSSSTRELVPFYQDKEYSQAPAFIVDLKSKETDLKLESIRHNKSPILPIIQSRSQSAYKLYLEKHVLSSPLYSSLIEQIGNVLKFSFNQHVPLLLIAPKGSGKRLVLRHVSDKYGLNYVEKDVKKAGSLNQIERVLFKGVNMRPCLIHMRNMRSLVHFVHKTQEEPQKLMIKYVQEFIHKFELLEKQICSSAQCVLVFTMDRFDDASTVDNTLKNIFTEYFILEKLADKTVYEHNLRFHIQEQSFFDHNNSKQLEILLRVSQGIPLFTFQKAVQLTLQSKPIEVNIIQDILNNSLHLIK